MYDARSETINLLKLIYPMKGIISAILVILAAGMTEVTLAQAQRSREFKDK